MPPAKRQKTSASGQSKPGGVRAASAATPAFAPERSTSPVAHASKKAAGLKKKPASAARPPAVTAPPPPKATAQRGFSSNWQAIKAAVGATGEGKKRKAETQAAVADPGKRLSSKGTNTGLTQVISMDCEMVGVGPDGKRSALARVCIVNNDGNVLMDAHVRPKERVTDFRTWVSGVEPHHLQGEGVLELEEAQVR
ncbi:hypothetical protein FOA52_013118 [Chlamydomonas sp. UWO 241]|nr:hypothetical protein FOA52_013118 [Chlamydomonas sp. UWO 241]